MEKVKTINYFRKRESKWGYKIVLRGIKHYGLFPNDKKISIKQSQRNMEDYLGNKMGLPAGSFILDAGSGDGHVAGYLIKKFSWRVEGIDLLSESVLVAQKNYSDLKNRVNFSQGTYEDLHFNDSTFDGVYTMETLMHAENYKKALSELYRVLKPGGRIVNHEYALDDHLPPEAEQPIKTMFYKGSLGGTFDDFRINKIKEIWKKAGFENVELEDLTPRVIPFMRHLYKLAIIPFFILKMFNKEEKFINIYSAVMSYKLRKHFHYVCISGNKPK